MSYLALAVVCSLMIGMIFKWASRTDLDRLRLLTVNYIVAALVAAAALETVGGPVSGRLIGFGLFTGVLFIVGFLLFARATAEAGMALAISVMRISVAIPFVGSWLIWGEPAGPAQWAGLGLAAVALGLITRKNERESARSTRSASTALILLLLFLAGGTVDLTMKAFDIQFADRVDPDLFIVLIFGAAFVTGVIWMLARPETRRLPSRREIAWGALLGVVNYGSVWFLLAAVARIPGTIVFPTNSVAIVIGAALLGSLIWKEELTRSNWAGVAVATVALLLLNIQG